MERRKFVTSALVIGGTASFHASMGSALAFGLPKLGGGGGGGASWTDIVKTAKGTMSSAAGAAAKAYMAMNDMADAIGFKQQSGLTAATIKELEGGNDENFADVVKDSESRMDDLAKAMEEKKEWTAAEKEKMSVAYGKYAFAMVDVGKGVVGVIALTKQIKDAGKPGLTDLDAINVAKDIPPLASVVAEQGSAVIGFWGKVVKLSKTADIAIPKKAMEAANGAKGNLGIGG
jgi:hypothetical protein